jgi:drug/metabolite transporter (DMT)-like permease/protein-S-isoprenylcysteine O-methyltransferase Ste14
LTFKDLLLLVLLGVIWGASFLFIKVGVATIPPFTFVFGRTALAWILLYSIVRIRGRRMPRPGPIWFSFAMMGFLNGAIPYTLITWGEIHIDSGLAAILNSLMPLFTVILAHLLTGDEKLSRRKAAGVAVGFSGVVVLMGPEALAGLTSSLLGQMAVIGAAGSYALATIYGKRLKGTPSTVLATGQMAAAAAWTLPLSLWIDRPWTLAPSVSSVAAMLCLSVLGTGLAYIFYYHLLARIGATNLSLVTYIIPVTGVLWGAAILGERIGINALLALGLIMAGIAGTGGGASVMGTEEGFTFDPFGWARCVVSERSLHLSIRIGGAVVCAGFLIVRFLQYRDFLLKPLWAAETLIFVILVFAFLVRQDPVDRSRGAREIVVPVIGSLLPFALLTSDPATWFLTDRGLLLGVFWWMTLATGWTVWGMWALRRSFSITVEARSLVSEGPFRWVRHPIYLGEILTAAAVAMWRFSLANVVILGCFVGIQLYRAKLEENKLQRSLPGYGDFRERTWWVIK